MVCFKTFVTHLSSFFLQFLCFFQPAVPMVSVPSCFHHMEFYSLDVIALLQKNTLYLYSVLQSMPVFMEHMII
jgi:hypothetical protein